MISAGGVASPSLMPGQTVGKQWAARLIRNGDSSFELWMPAYVHMLIFI